MRSHTDHSENPIHRTSRLHRGLWDDADSSEGLYSVPEGSLGVKLGSRPNPGTGQLCDLGQMASLLWPTWSPGTYPINLLILSQLDRNAEARRLGTGARVRGDD